MQNKLLKLTSCGILTVLLSACQSTPPPTFSSPPPVTAPAVTPVIAPVSQTTTTGKTTISDDGSTVTTEQTTTTIGFDPSKAISTAANAPLLAPANTGLTGQWQMVSSSSGASCNVALYGAPAATNGKAASDCPSGFILNGLSAWAYDGGQLSLQKGSSTVLSLQQLGPNRFDGTASNGFVATTITLKR